MWFILLAMQHILSEHLLYARHWSLVNKANKTPSLLGLLYISTSCLLIANNIPSYGRATFDSFII